MSDDTPTAEQPAAAAQPPPPAAAAHQPPPAAAERPVYAEQPGPPPYAGQQPSPPYAAHQPPARGRWSDRWGGGRRGTLLAAVALLLAGCLLGAGGVAIGVLVGHRDGGPARVRFDER